ncbi:MAG: OmpA family protein [Cyclobacteriaceae bacterium]
MHFFDKYFAFILCLILSVNSYAQTSSGSMVKVSGTLYALEDSSKIEGRVLYEKMPYYDDMGMASSNKEGIYNIYLLRGNTYNIEVSGSGYETVKSEIVPSVDEDTEITRDFYLPISEELRIIKLENLIFARGRSIISSDSYSELNDLVQWLVERPEKIIQLEGHTDFQGNAAANMQLSQDRVDAVKEYLVEKKIKKNRVLTKAFGGTQPLSTERNDEAQALNRRVEVRIIN